jgi:hypothetical protein
MSFWEIISLIGLCLVLCSFRGPNEFETGNFSGKDENDS